MSEVTLSILDREGHAKSVSAKEGDLLMRVLRDQIDLTLGTCGGEISCGTCLVRLNGPWLGAVPAAGEDEAEMLEALDAGAGCRLSCQLTLDSAADGSEVTIMPAT